MEEEEPFELPTLEEVARATGTLRSEPLGDFPLAPHPIRAAKTIDDSKSIICLLFTMC